MMERKKSHLLDSILDRVLSGLMYIFDADISKSTLTVPRYKEAEIVDRTASFRLLIFQPWMTLGVVLNEIACE